MQLTLSTESPDLPKHKCLALGIFSDEKPPRGIGGFIDWRLNGMISREIKQGRIGGAFEEKTVIPFPRRIGSEIILLFGLGNTYEINYDKIYNAAYIVAQAVEGMAMNSFAFDLYGEGRSNLVIPDIVEAIITGIFDSLSTDINKLAGMTACIITPPSNLDKVSLGISQFKTNVNDRGSVDVSALENSFV
jgi:hypothetical protein